MPSNFINSTRDHKFILKEWLDMNEVLSTDRFRDGYSIDDMDFILDNALKGARDVVAPTCADSDQTGAKFINGKVVTPESSKTAYFFIQQNGLCTSNYDPQDPSAVPLCVVWAMLEYLVGANPSLGTLYQATAGASGLIQDYGSERLKETYLRKMYSGQWSGTMDLTEPNAGSELGNLTTKAVPTAEPGVYRISGSKQFISGGDQDITENIIHLTLAKIEGAPQGTAGISLFVVPKFLPDENGDPGKFNDVNCGGIEHKLGIKGNPTCVINFGDQNDCLGFLLGDVPEPGAPGKGLAQMFDMMNEERLLTGHSAMALATVAYYNALDYARQRLQGKKTFDPKSGQVPIIHHEDIRRSLMLQKSYTEAFRALILRTFYDVDLKKWSSDPEDKKFAVNRIEVNTPIIKAFCSDVAVELIGSALQIYGGYGFSEEYPCAELYRDCRIYPIWEGTNYIQSMDFCGRKMTMKKGEIFGGWLTEFEDFIDDNAGHPAFVKEFFLLNEAFEDFNVVVSKLNLLRTEGKEDLVKFYAQRVLHAAGKLICGKLLLEMAVIAHEKRESLDPDDADCHFYDGKVASARFFARNVLPEICALISIVNEADTTAMTVDERIFG